MRRFSIFNLSPASFVDWNGSLRSLPLFHTNAEHLTLDDSAYNTERNITAGNPYKDLVASLQRRGVRVELCGATASADNCGDAELRPGIEVNTDAMARTTELVQNGFV